MREDGVNAFDCFRRIVKKFHFIVFLGDCRIALDLHRPERLAALMNLVAQQQIIADVENEQ